MRSPLALRILRLIARLNIGGPARHVTILDAGLRARGHTTLLAFGPVRDGEGSLEHLAESLPTHRIPELGRRIHLYDDAVAFVRIVRLMFRHRPDVVHTHTAKAGTLGRLAAAFYNLVVGRRRRARVVHTFHGHVLEGYFGPIGDRLVRATERRLAAVTDRIVAISPRQRRDLTERFRISDPARVAVVRLGLDLEPLLAIGSDAPTLRESLAIPHDAVVVGFIGRLVPIKDPLTLLAAFAAVVKDYPAAVLLIAGDGPLESEVRREVKARGLQAHVRLAGWQHDLPALYATCDVVVLASRNEGTPVAVIEAMAAGRPVVATAVGGVPDVVDDGRTGILVNAGASQELADGLGRLLRDARLREAMGREARTVAASRFTHERLVADIEQLYQQLTGGR